MKKSLQRIKRLLALMVLALVLLPIAGCGNPAPETVSSGAGKIKVAVSIVPQASFVAAVGGDLVEIVTMIPPAAIRKTMHPTQESWSRRVMPGYTLPSGLQPNKTAFCQDSNSLVRTCR